jgi:hypothetical protein
MRLIIGYQDCTSLESYIARQTHGDAVVDMTFANAILAPTGSAHYCEALA